MKITLRHDRMEDIEGLHNAYPYAYHYADLRMTLVPWHWHEALEFNYIVSGSVKVSTTGQSQVFSQGEGFFVNSNVLATMVNQDRCVMDSHLFHPVFLGGHFKSVFETKYLQPVTQNKHIDLVPIRGGSDEERQLLQKLRQLTAVQAREDSEFQTRNLLSEIWLLLLQVIKSTDSTNLGQHSKNQDRILSMMAFIRDNYPEKLTLEQIAQAAAVSPRECLRCFRGSIGQSPMDYLISCRIDGAKKLLQATTLPITEIALRTGFNSPAYFSKQFRAHTGKTPNAYRKEMQALEKDALEDL